jgi:hypothetical protein
MGQIEQTELDRQRRQIGADVAKLVEKYRAIFAWDVPELDEAAADELIVAAFRQALADAAPTGADNKPSA